MPDAINVLATQAAATLGGIAHTYAAVDALTARMLIVEDGGEAFPQGTDIGAPDDPTGKWSGILVDAGVEPGMYSWWNAIPCGLDRPATAEEKGKGRTFLNRAVALHTELQAVVAVGGAAERIVRSAALSVKIWTSRSPTRASRTQREEICSTLQQARLYAYPLGLDPDR